MNEQSDQVLKERAIVFDEVVEPAFIDSIGQYNGAVGMVVKIVPDGPLILGINRHSSLMIRHPNGVEMIVCVYWVEGSTRLIAENIRIVTLGKTFDIFAVTK